MRQFARTVGFLYLASGVFLLGFPEASRRLMRTREEFAKLSAGALRLLGIWELLSGALLVAMTMSPAEQARVMERIPPEVRKAA